MKKIIFMLTMFVCFIQAKYVSQEYIDSIVNGMNVYESFIEVPEQESEPVVTYEENMATLTQDTLTNYPLMNEGDVIEVMMIEDVSYWNNGRYVLYKHKDLKYKMVDGIVELQTTTYNETVSKGTTAIRNNNPGNLTCSSGTRKLALLTMHKDARFKGDRHTCVYVNKEKGFLDMKNLLLSKQYNKHSILQDFYKYQDDKRAFRKKLNVLTRNGININNKFEDLSEQQQQLFMDIWSKYEGFYQDGRERRVVTKRKTTRQAYYLEETPFPDFNDKHISKIKRSNA